MPKCFFKVVLSSFEGLQKGFQWVGCMGVLAIKTTISNKNQSCFKKRQPLMLSYMKFLYEYFYPFHPAHHHP